MKRPELLLPVRSWPNLKSALNYANAVYFGAKDLNMRARAGNFTLNDIKKVVDICHKNKIKAYLTINVVIYQKDIKTLEKVLNAAKKAKIDAIICWDWAVIEAAKKRNLPIHISTQANISNSKTATMYKNLGAKRIVLARECSLADIKKIKKETDIEIETFIHGAMCVSISGRCYLSSYLYGKSANCGDCLQPCRQNWTLKNEENNEIVCEGKYLMSAKDLCMIEHVPELIKAGITSFKVEGRLRDARYVETTGKCYKEAINAVLNKTYTLEKINDWLKQLKSVYNRGFSTGFYYSKPGKNEFTYDSANTQATHTRKQIGIVTNYYPKNKVAAVRILTDKLNIGDEIIVEGKTTYIKQIAESINLNTKSTNSAKKGDIIGLKLNDKARKNDWIYVVKNKNK
ncbi:U32 family peptidase [archaeon]|nr:U32 family peptidase [archaeon]